MKQIFQNTEEYLDPCQTFIRQETNEKERMLTCDKPFWQMNKQPPEKFYKKAFLKVLQYLRENTNVGVSLC